MTNKPDATAPHWKMDAIRGGTYTSGDFAGKVVLVVNTASMCGYTPQYTAMQGLYDDYKDRGLVVLAVPSDDFHQEKPNNAEVASFCETTFGINLPMSVIEPVTGPNAHPLYLWLQGAGFQPDWNFNKVLLDRKGRVAGTWGSDEPPQGGAIEQAVQRALSD